MTRVFSTAADETFGYHLLNLLGSVAANSDVFDEIVVWDLGLSTHQRDLLNSVRAVEVRVVPPFVQHWAQGYTWKPWVWTQLAGDAVMWVDAGATVLRSLEPALAQIGDRGYCLVSQGGRLGDILPPGWFEEYGIPQTFAERPYVAAGVIGFAPRSEFYERVIVPTRDDCLAGRSVGFSAGEVATKNRGLIYEPTPVIRDCPQFRHDQSLLNAHLFAEYPEPVVNDVYEFAGFETPHEHPRQLIWHHRRRGNLAYLQRVHYTGRNAVRGRLFGLAYRIRWWRKLHQQYFRRETYVLKAKSLLQGRG